MIFSKDLLFLHVPKTGGSSVTVFLLQHLPKPVFYSHPNFGSVTTTPEGVVQIPGVGHENMAEAVALARRHGVEDCTALPLVLATVRNPYAFEVSRFAYLQKKLVYDKGFNQDLALYEDFETFTRESYDVAGETRPLAGYYQHNGAAPRNLKLLRTENLEADLLAALCTVGIKPAAKLPVVNTSKHDEFVTYYTRASEAAVFARYAWIFEQKFYARLSVDELPESKPPAAERRAIPLGYAHQLAPVEGLRRDGSVNQRLRVTVGALRAIKDIVVEGVTGDATELFLRANNLQTRAAFAGGQPFRWIVPCPLAQGETADVTIESTDNAAFQLKQLTFREA